jgi:hypothetical protein
VPARRRVAAVTHSDHLRRALSRASAPIADFVSLLPGKISHLNSAQNTHSRAATVRL